MVGLSARLVRFAQFVVAGDRPIRTIARPDTSVVTFIVTVTVTVTVTFLVIVTVTVIVTGAVRVTVLITGDANQPFILQRSPGCGDEGYARAAADDGRCASVRPG